MWVISANTTVGSEPHHVFAIDKNGINMVRTKPARSTVKCEAVDVGAVDSERTAPIRADPQIITRSPCKNNDSAGWRVHLVQMCMLAQLKQPTGLIFGLGANDYRSTRPNRDRLNEESTRLHIEFVRGSVFDCENSTATRTHKQSVACHRQAGQIQWPILVTVNTV